MLRAMAVEARYEGRGRATIAVRTVAAVAERMLSAMGLMHAELSILLCDDPTIHELNRTYRNQDKPTDVLAFAMQEGAPLPQGASLMLGDVVISIPTARRQADEHARTLQDEVVELLAHGLLHLLGFDHPDRDQERRMRARTDLLRSTAGQVPRSVENPGAGRARPS